MDEVEDVRLGEEDSSESRYSEEESEAYDNTAKKPQSDSALSLGTVESAGTTASTAITEEDVTKARDELQKKLQEEQMVTGLQMQLLLQLDELNASIASAESEERMAKLAMQQAHAIRLMKKTQDPNSNTDEEKIVIRLRR